MREPDMSGAVALAWRIPIPDPPTNPALAANLGSWLVAGPWHPVWSRWMVSSCHLRDVPGQQHPPVRRFAKATHEVACYSLMSPPSSEEVPDPDVLATLKPLLPPDFIFQFEGTDEQARQLCDAVVKVAVRRGQSLDSDWRAWWVRSLQGTLEHIQAGQHQ